MPVILFDNSERQKLYPLTLTRAVSDIQTGIYTAKERWMILSQEEVYVFTAAYLQPLYGELPAGIHLFIDASVIADESLAEHIMSLKEGAAIFDSKGFIAGRFELTNKEQFLKEPDTFVTKIYQVQQVRRLNYAHDIFRENNINIKNDFLLAVKNKTTANISSTNKIIKGKNIFIEEGAQVEYAVLNATSGPVYIGKNATVMEGCLIRGPFTLGKNAVLKMGAKIYGATSIGNNCTAGGEIKNAVMHAYSNKAHDGYLGDSVIGSWCNLGAGTSNSNVKNTATEVMLWNESEKAFINVGNKCGVIMGDYSRTAINTSINTGTVAGVCCNIFGEGLSPKIIESFSWGMHQPKKYQLEKALRDINNWKKLKHQVLSDEEREVLTYIFAQLSKQQS